MNKKNIKVKQTLLSVMLLVIITLSVTPVYLVKAEEGNILNRSMEIADATKTDTRTFIEIYGKDKIEEWNKAASVADETYKNSTKSTGLNMEDWHGFYDVSTGDWYYEDVLKARTAGLVKGVSELFYEPDSKITYADFLTVLTRIVDRSVTSLKDGDRWYDKYIDCAKSLGIIDKYEIVNAETAISREMMIKYTCKALNIKTYIGNEVIFTDVSIENAGYINAAYNEYLTEGSGRDQNGNIIFGYGQLAERSELAAMANRIADYKKDTEDFKTEKATERKNAEKNYQNALVGIEKTYLVNGYTIPKEIYENDIKNKNKDEIKHYYLTLLCEIHNGDQIVDGIEYSGTIDIFSGNYVQYINIMQKLLESKWGSCEAINDAIAYVIKADPIKNLSEKYFKLGDSGYQIEVYQSENRYVKLLVRKVE